MKEVQIEIEIGTIFRRVFSNKDLFISPSTSASDIEGWDSLTHIEIIAEIESCFKIHFSFNEVVSFQNVGDIIRCVTKQLSNKK